MGTAHSSYLNAVAEDHDLKLLLSALRDVVEAQGGIGPLAKKSGLARAALYRTLSVNGNPEFETLDAILAATAQASFWPTRSFLLTREQNGSPGSSI